ETAWLPADRAAGVHDLAAAGQGLVAVGWHGDQGEGDSAAWTSHDGLSWSRLDLKQDRLAGPGAQWLAAVTVAGEEVVALGRSTTYRDDHLILWTYTLTAGRRTSLRQDPPGAQDVQQARGEGRPGDVVRGAPAGDRGGVDRR